MNLTYLLFNAYFQLHAIAVVYHAVVETLYGGKETLKKTMVPHPAAYVLRKQMAEEDAEPILPKKDVIMLRNALY